MSFQHRELELNTELMAYLNGSGHWSHHRGSGVPHEGSLCPSAGPLGQCGGVRMWGKGDWGVEPSSLHRSLRGSCVRLSTSVPWSSPLPFADPYQWCALSHHPGDISHCQYQTEGLVPAPPTPSLSGTPALQVDGKCWHHSPDQVAPTPRGLRQVEEKAADIDEVQGSAQREKAMKEPRREAFSRSLTLWRQLDSSTRRPTGPTLNRRDDTASPPSSSRWPHQPTCWTLRSMKCRRPRVAKRTSGSLTRQQGLLQKTSTFSRLSFPQSCQGSWASRASIPQRPCEDEVVWPSASGVTKRVSMRKWCWNTCELWSTTLALLAPVAWTT